MQSQSNKNNIKLLQHILDYRKPTFGEIRLLLIHNKTAFVKKKKNPFYQRLFKIIEARKFRNKWGTVQLLTLASCLMLEVHSILLSSRRRLRTNALHIQTGNTLFNRVQSNLQLTV